MASLYENTPITLTVSILTLFLTAITRSTTGVSLNIIKILHGEVSRLFLSQFIYGSIVEGIVGTIILFSCRQFERQMGSRKYGAFLFLCWILFTLLSIAVSTLLISIGYTLIPATGPYFFVFAQLAFYYKYIPKIFSSFSVLGVEMSEKSGIYLLAVQVLFSHGLSSLLAGLIGFLTGYLYDVDGMGLQKFRFPAFIETIFRFLGTMLRVLFPARSSGNNAQNQLFATPQQPEHTPIPRNNNATNPLIRRRESAQAPANNNNNFFDLPPPDEESILNLMNLGFGRDEVVQALRNSGNNLDGAANLLLR